MHIICPKCSTKFLVSEQQIGNRGQKVRCSSCNHVWSVETKDILNQKENVSKLIDDKHLNSSLFKTVDKVMSEIKQETQNEQNINLPMVVPVKEYSNNYQLSVIVFGLIIVLSVILFPNIFSSHSVFSHQYLQIQEMNVDKIVDQEKLVVNYKIYNSADHDIKVPFIRVRIFDDSGNIIKSNTDDHHHKIIVKAHKKIKVQTEFLQVPQNGAKVDVTIGNQLDMLLN